MLVLYGSQVLLAEKLDSTYNANVVEVVNVFQHGHWNYQAKHVINDSIDGRTINKVIVISIEQLIVLM